jgi:hypothetical protein
MGVRYWQGVGQGAWVSPWHLVMRPVLDLITIGDSAGEGE